LPALPSIRQLALFHPFKTWRVLGHGIQGVALG
jgi:hypothetical protein